jgi:hypothetical protein
MPKAFDTWQVFPHRPLEKLAPNLWRVEGDLPNGNGTRVMTIARRRDGSLLIHNAVALEDSLMAEIEAFGQPSLLVVPGGFHRLDAVVFQRRYPAVKVICPAGARKKVAQVVKVDGTYGEGFDDGEVRLFHLRGVKELEGVLEVKSGGETTVVFNDVVNNLPKLSGLFGFVLAPTGRPGVPRVARWLLVKNRAALRGHLDEVAATPNLARVIVAHGRVISDGPAEALRAVARAL